MNIRLWIDDERSMPLGYNHNAATSKTAIAAIANTIKYAYHLELISFDHDLGGDDTSRPVMLWMIEHNAWPDTIRFHTANPVGREWLVGMAQRYAPDHVNIDITNPYDNRGFENYG